MPWKTSLIVLALMPSGCAHAASVRGPDGEPAHLIRCDGSFGASASACYEKATEVCPEGYELRSVGGGGHEILVSCKSDLPAPKAAAAEATSPNRDDARVCDAAAKHVDGFKTFWGTNNPRLKLLVDAPETRDFVATCRDMPEPVQRCLHEKYRSAHVKSCDAVLTRIEPAQRRRIDALFFEAEAASAP